ncbi:SOS response-associated peptidase [Herbaspirillum sp. YR522]|uniref:SOS response-associated peptidase n=1 Tax=Herbaspirillum sp. YR522 TaxID=1144342 RepID=UPI00026F5CBD|nr:SOS response-associated peptidase family protein [Herbaspirillum sp. YR522]EJN01746.1 hypothetical protein PMI40_03233 [Herbaspirillum sp. YR522]
MCLNYKAGSKEIVAGLTGADIDGASSWSDEIWQDYAAPVIRAGQGGAPELIVGTYGMVPRRIQQPDIRQSTMNARAETIASKPAYSRQWHTVQTCLLPTQWFYEPNYESGFAERWAIGMADDQPFCVAGIWKPWTEEDGSCTFSFAQITINADGHPLMNLFHKPGEEKRSLVIVPRSQYRHWLNIDSPQAARAILALYPAGLMKAWRATKGRRTRPMPVSLF